MSRRELASKAGISERYIAKIEAGEGNVSIVLLLRIIHAVRQG
jgi:transcriptional regulator with XRE-family HTH domain